MFDFLNRGFLMDEAGGDAGGGVAVAEPSSDFGGETGSDTGTEATAEVHDAEFVDPDAAAEPQQVSTAVVKAGERAVQNGRFTPSGKAAIEALRPLSPRLAQEVTQALLTRDWFQKEFPGGKREIQALRQLAESNGGESGVAELKSTVSFFNNLDEMFSASDPRFFDEITSTEDERRALAGLMEPAFRKFEQIDGPQFGHQVSKAFAHLLDTARVPVTCGRIVDLINRAAKYAANGQHEMASSFVTEIAQSYNELSDVLSKIYDSASKSPARQAAAPQLSEREQQLTQRERQLRDQEWNSSVSGERKRIFSKAWAEATKGRSLTSDQDATVKGFYELRMSAKIRNWQNNADRFRSNGDKDGFLREQYAFFQKAIPEALRQAIQQALPAKPGPKVNGNAKPVLSRGAGHGTSGGKAPTRVARMPSTSELDPVRTTSEMLAQNRAMRKDGTIVQWA